MNIKKKPLCKNCGLPVKRRPNIFCNSACSAEYRHKQATLRNRKLLKSWREGSFVVTTNSIPRWLRSYIFEKYGNACSVCGWCKVNPYTNKVPLDVEHIDGNFMNNSEKNLTLLCPNCHAMTSTYKGANYGNGRAFRLKYKLP